MRVESNGEKISLRRFDKAPHPLDNKYRGGHSGELSRGWGLQPPLSQGRKVSDAGTSDPWRGSAVYGSLHTS